MNRRAWVWLWGLALFLVGCGASDAGPTPVVRAKLSGDSVLVAHFREAEAESGVPAEILATVAYVQSRLTMHSDAERGLAPEEIGVMAIGGGGLTTPERAAELTGLSPAQIRSDARANVRAGAALLADAQGGELPPGDLGWEPALEAYGGRELVDVVVRLLADGFVTTDDAGNVLRVEGHGVRGQSGTAQQALAPGAIWNPAYSGNYTNASRGAAQINYVVIHTTQGSYSGTISWFKNPSSKVSAHYVVRSSDGQVTQMVDDSDIAWHDACFNSNSIGIEHEGYVADPGKWYTKAMYAASAKLVAWLCDKYGIPKDHSHIMGHGETPDCSDHTDPGSGWDWGYYLGLVKNGGACTPTGCNGTKLVSSCGEGDCAAYGATCVNDNLGPRCASVFCPAQGKKKVCVPNTTLIGDCNNGALSTGDCAAFGATCVEDELGARCVSVFCPAKGKHKVCIDDKKIMDCSDGAPSEPGDCSVYGAFCSTAGSTEAHCASVFCVADANEVPTAHDVCLPNGQLGHCDDKAGISAEDCPAGKPCTETAGGAQCGDQAATGGAGGGDTGGSGGKSGSGGSVSASGGATAGASSSSQKTRTFEDDSSGCACRTAPAGGSPGGEGPLTLLFAGLALGLARRSRLSAVASRSA